MTPQAFPAPAAPVFYYRVTASRALRVADAIGLRPTLDPTTHSQEPGSSQEQGEGPDKRGHHPDQTPKPVSYCPCPRGLTSGKAAHTSASNISRYESGERKAIPFDLAFDLDDALGAVGALAAVAGYRRPSEFAADREMVDDVERRRLLQSIAAVVTAGSVADRASLGDIVSQLSERQPGGAIADDWAETADEYGYAYLAHPRAEVMRDLAAELASLQLMSARRWPDNTIRSLKDSGARLAGLLAMACTDVGYDREARHAWQLARNWAGVSKQPDTEMWIRGNEAALALYARRPIPTIQRLVDQGMVVADNRRSTGYADLLGARAQIIALENRERDALAALDDMRRVADRLPTVVGATGRTAFAWSEQRLRHSESFVYGVLGHSEAPRAHERALAMYPAERVISRCQIELHRAMHMARVGEPLAGVRHANGQLTGLAAPWRGRFVLMMATRILRMVPRQLAERSDVVEYRQLLVSSGAQVD